MCKNKYNLTDFARQISIFSLTFSAISTNLKPFRRMVFDLQVDAMVLIRIINMEKLFYNFFFLTFFCAFYLQGQV